MISGGQNQIGGHEITVRNGAGAVVDTFVFPNSVAQGGDQRTILIADTMGPIGADFTWAGINLGQQLTAGAVCFEDGSPPDCFSWGLGFTGASALPGPPMAAFPGDIPTSNSLSRGITAGCNTLLEASDDTNTVTDYVNGMPSPRPNSVAPTESLCPQTAIVAKPAARTTDRTPRFTFSGGDDYRCKIDRDPFQECGTPFRPGSLAVGRHKIQVKATENDGSVDPTPAKYAWKINPR
jgi:hypothetical protein